MAPGRAASVPFKQNSKEVEQKENPPQKRKPVLVDPNPMDPGSEDRDAAVLSELVGLDGQESCSRKQLFERLVRRCVREECRTLRAQMEHEHAVLRASVNDVQREIQVYHDLRSVLFDLKRDLLSTQESIDDLSGLEAVERTVNEIREGQLYHRAVMRGILVPHEDHEHKRGDETPRCKILQAFAVEEQNRHEAENAALQGRLEDIERRLASSEEGSNSEACMLLERLQTAEKQFGSMGELVLRISALESKPEVAGSALEHTFARRPSMEGKSPVRRPSMEPKKPEKLERIGSIVYREHTTPRMGVNTINCNGPPSLTFSPKQAPRVEPPAKPLANIADRCLAAGHALDSSPLYNTPPVPLDTSYGSPVPAPKAPARAGAPQRVNSSINNLMSAVSRFNEIMERTGSPPCAGMKRMASSPSAMHHCRSSSVRSSHVRASSSRSVSPVVFSVEAPSRSGMVRPARHGGGCPPPC